MKFPFKHNIRYPQTFITTLLILALVAGLFKITVSDDVQKTVYDPIIGHLECLCGAIAGLKYGQERYICPKEVYEKLERTPISFGTSPAAINNLIKEATELKNVNWQEKFFVGETIGAGYTDYAYLAFLLFGFKIESLLYLYFLILCISIVVFWAALRRDSLGPFLLIIFLLSHYVPIKAFSYLGYNLGSVANYRFLPVLVILPLMHILRTGQLGQRLNGYTFAGVLLQSSIILFILWVRGSAIWAVILLVCGVVVKIFFNLLKSRFSLKNTRPEGFTVISDRIRGFRLWPIVLFLSMFLFLIMGKPLILGTKYDKDSGPGYHPVWSAIYVGLALHPEIRENYSKAVYDNTVYGISRGERVHGPVCSEENMRGNPMKVAVKEWLCADAQRWVFEVIYAIKHSIEYPPNDQDGHSAAFKWLRNHGSSEYYLFNFQPEDQVDYQKPFAWFNHNSDVTAKRQFNMQEDFNWSRYDLVLKDVLKDIARTHPLQIVQNILIDKPIRYLRACFYYVSLNYLPLLFLPIVFFHFLMIEQSRTEVLQSLKLLAVVFSFSLIPALLVYPAHYLIADSVLILAMIIFIIFFAFLRTQVDILKKKIWT